MKTLFIRKHSHNAPWWKVLIWWELRRLVFNLICIPVIYLTGANISESANAKGGGSPIVYILFIVLFLVFINTYYTLFWITDLIIRAVREESALPIQPYLYIISIVTTIIGSKLILHILYI